MQGVVERIVRPAKTDSVAAYSDSQPDSLPHREIILDARP